MGCDSPSDPDLFSFSESRAYLCDGAVCIEPATKRSQLLLEQTLQLLPANGQEISFFHARGN